MSSVAIVRGIRSEIQTKLLPVTNRYWRSQLQFGIEAYSLRSFQSAAGNARTTAVKPRTGLRRCERLFANDALADQLGHVFDSLELIRPGSYVNVDHSDMNGLSALVGAIQTRNGRAIPCLVETTYSDRLPSHTNAPARKQALRRARAKERRYTSFTGHYIDALQGLHDRLGFWPKLIFDRGFGNESLVTHLAAEGATFYLRLKGGRCVHLDGQRIETKHLSETDVAIQLFGLTLRVIRSPKSRRAREPWYILTNDMTASRSKIVRIYYHRFEIEETFKDMKHVFELKRTRLNKPLSLKLLLWFVSLGIALLYRATKPTKQYTARQHPKKQISWIRRGYEELQQAYGLLLWGMG
ncbi:transposase [Candidatus Saccharibacteria bacterium]|nr:MAG: transposase [Candidatus Saccharibacteria bacterium]